MLLPILLVLIANADEKKPGPIDAFRANFSSIQAIVDFEWTTGSIASRSLTRDHVWDGDLNFIGQRKLTRVGRWGCDGTTEYFLFSSPQDVIDAAKEEAKQRKSAKEPPLFNYIPRFELLFDGEYVLCREQTQDSATMATTNQPSQFAYAKGPFFWSAGGWPFPAILSQHFQKAEPKRTTGIAGGYACEIETYFNTQIDGWNQLEIYYDTSASYVPRYLRRVKYIKDKDLAYVTETFVVRIEKCRAGGFIPMDWYQTVAVISRFGSRYPDYDEKTALSHSGECDIERFKALNLEDLHGPVRLINTQGLKWIGARGGRIPTTSLLGALSIPTLKRALGSRLTALSSPSLPGIDRDAVADVRKTPQQYGLLYALAGVAAIIVVLRFVGKRFWTALLIFALLTSGGCGFASKPVAHLSASFPSPRILYEANMPFSSDLVLKNDGNRTVLIRDIDAGCACRRVDRTRLPMAVKSGETVTLKVKGLTQN